MSTHDDAPCSSCTPDVEATQLTRRELMGAAAGVVVAGCAGKAQKFDATSVPTTDGIVELEVSEHPELATAGGMLAVKPDGAKKPVLVMRLENNQFRVLSLKCTHLGCVVRWDNEMQDLVCPCHGSRFADTGQVTHGPAKDSLRGMRSEFTGMKGATGGTKLRFILDEG